jgi:hypothetical protein
MGNDMRLRNYNKFTGLQTIADVGCERLWSC